VTGLPVLDPSAACHPAVAGQLRVDLEGQRALLGREGGYEDPGAVNRAADRLAALDDDALLDAWRQFTDHGGIGMWLLFEVWGEPPPPPAEDPAVRAMAAEASAPPAVAASTPGAPGAVITIRPGG